MSLGLEHRVIGKLLILSGMVALTLGIHYGWIGHNIFGHSEWLHAIHGRFCYVPIVIAAAWFGLRGGIATAAVISLLVIPYIINSAQETSELVSELTDIIFYFGIGILAGALVDRELFARRRAEEARVSMERSQKFTLLGQIAAGMAHEIKNPLASIKGAVEILSDETTAAEEREEFNEIVTKEIRRINSSLSDFLQFARPSETRLVRTNLTELVRASLRQVEVQARRHNIRLESTLAEDIYAEVDREKIHQVLLNLLLNAIEASREDSTVQVSLTTNAHIRHALIRVEDSGHGIDEADLPRIFEPYFSTKKSGSGLGLAIVKSIIDQHGGAIELRNRPEGGVIAEVSLLTVSSGE